MFHFFSRILFLNCTSHKKRKLLSHNFISFFICALHWCVLEIVQSPEIEFFSTILIEVNEKTDLYISDQHCGKRFIFFSLQQHTTHAQH